MIPSPSRVTVVRALPGLGDMLCIVPTLRALRAALPDARISLIGLPAAAAVLDRLPHLVDELVEFPGYPGLPEVPLDPARLTAFLTREQERPAGLVLQLHGSGVQSNAFAALLGGRVTAGFHLPAQWCPDERWFLPFRWDEPEVRRGLRLLEHLGIPARGEELELPLSSDDHAAAAELRSAAGLVAGEYACLHPGASREGRRWPAESFVAAGRALAAEGLRVAVTGVSGEAELTRRVTAGIGAAAADLGGRTSLGALAALLAGSRLLVANDTGVAHVAVALGTPSVAVATWSDPRRWGPLDRERHRLIPRGDARAGLTDHSLGDAWAGVADHCLGDACIRMRPPREGVRPAPTREVVEAARDLLRRFPQAGLRAMTSPSTAS